MGPQCQRVLRVLRREPTQGTCQADWLGPNIIDGGPRITRLAARIYDLRTKHGFEIDEVGERFGYTVYKLRQERPVAPVTDERPAPSPPGGGGSPETLFVMPSRRRSPYDQDAA